MTWCPSGIGYNAVCGSSRYTRETFLLTVVKGRNAQVFRVCGAIGNERKRCLLLEEKG